MSDDYPYYRAERGRISQDYSRCDTSMYRPDHLLTLVPSGKSSGGIGMIRDKDGSAIGGGEVWSFSDMNGAHYRLLITPAVFDAMRRWCRRPFSRSVPGEVSMVLDLREYPETAMEYIRASLFTSRVEYDEEGDSYYDAGPYLTEDQYEWLDGDRKTLMIKISEPHMISHVLSSCDYVEGNYLRSEDEAYRGGSPCIHTKVQYVFDFPEPWQLDRIRSPWFSNGRTAYREGQYAWYFGRYGVFDNFAFPTTWRRFAPADEEADE